MNLFKGLKKAVIKNRIETALNSDEYANIVEKVFDCISGVGRMYHNMFTAFGEAMIPMFKANPDKVATILAEAYDPISRIVNASKELKVIYDDNREFLGEVEKSMCDVLERYEDIMEQSTNDLKNDFKSIKESADKIEQEHLQ